jgi:hypothetical protein
MCQKITGLSFRTAISPLKNPKFFLWDTHNHKRVNAWDVENMESLGPSGDQKGEEKTPPDHKKEIDDLTRLLEQKEHLPSQSVGKIILPRQQESSMPVTNQKDRKLESNYFLLVIPSWHQATGASLGRYINQNVAKIHADPVIFFNTKEVAIETLSGTAYYLFGLGYYYMQFELADGKYITDNRPLTGLILSDFFYDKIATSKRIALEDEPDVNVCEHVIKVPIDLSYKSPQKLTFIRGMLTRFLFTKFKDPILEMMNKVYDANTYLIDQWGHLLLSTLPEFFNQIIVSSKMNAGAIKTYMNSVPGINTIMPAADGLLATNFSSANLLDIDESIQLLKTAITGVKIDPIDLYTLLDYLAMTLRAASPASAGRDARHRAGNETSDLDFSYKSVGCHGGMACIFKARSDGGIDSIGNEHRWGNFCRTRVQRISPSVLQENG